MRRVTFLSLAVLGTILAGCSSETSKTTEDAPSASGPKVAANKEPEAAPKKPLANVAGEGDLDESGPLAGDLNLERNKPMPSYTMTTTDGKRLTSASLKGKVVILDFWATWCIPCKMISPTMQKLNDRYKAKGLVVIGANAGERANAATAAKKYQAKHGYTYTFTGQNDELAQRLGLNVFPCVIFIDKKGNVRNVATGFSPVMGPMLFDKMVRKLLAEA